MFEFITYILFSGGDSNPRFSVLCIGDGDHWRQGQKLFANLSIQFGLRIIQSRNLTILKRRRRSHEPVEQKKLGKSFVAANTKCKWSCHKSGRKGQDKKLTRF
jgi:hypothetical protein